MALSCAIWMITYNHELYIRQAIEGIVNQKTSFPIKLFIGEDCSTDKTLEICMIYKKKYPAIIDLITTEKNNLVQNGLNVYNACFSSGATYIAMCEGDDYWTDPYKLQKQVDFLEANSDYAFCYHHVDVIQEGAINHRKLEMEKNQPETSTIAEILKKSIWPHINSLVFRKPTKLKNMPSWFSKCASGDWALLAMITCDKKIRYFNKTMSVYRQHATGMWSKNSKIKNYINTLKTAHILNKYVVNPRERKYIYWPVHYVYQELIEHYKLKNPIKAINYLLHSVLLDFKYNFIFKKEK